MSGLKIFQLHAILQHSAALIHAACLKWQTVEMYLHSTASAECTEWLCDCLTITRLVFVIPMSIGPCLCISNISPQDQPPNLRMVSEIRQLNRIAEYRHLNIVILAGTGPSMCNRLTVRGLISSVRPQRT